ncbi:MAG: Gfo/Idh/MocA family oxidoreductase [Anaerovibrio sp.]|nr:Gfo/Idh/MocA family oxidoreductase [Anaerovibrio sp.]
MNIIVVGLGSMGRRRIRLLKQINKDFNIAGVDSREDRCSKAVAEFVIRTFTDLQEAMSEMNPQCAVVSTSPLSHAGIIETCLQHNCNVFTELNLVKDKYASNIRLAQDRNKVLFLSSTCIYREEIRYIKKQVEQSASPLSYMYHIGQYLPDWHPWESINDFFVGDKKTNGCRELFAIELPWLTKTFGEVESFEVISGKDTKLPLTYKDNYLLLVRHKGGTKGLLGVDVVSRKPARNLEIYGEDLYLTWDGTPSGLKMFDFEHKEDKEIKLYEAVDRQDGYADFIIENGYLNELETFIGMVNGEGNAEYTFEDDLKVLELIDKIERGE